MKLKDLRNNLFHGRKPMVNPNTERTQIFDGTAGQASLLGNG